jgi:ABC-type transporter Mla subunit MlaD
MLRRERFVNDIYSIGQILWSVDPATQRAIWFVLTVSIAAAVTIYVPLIFRLIRLQLLERELRELADELSPSRPTSQLDDFKALLVASPIQSVYEEFEERWTTAQLPENTNRAPVRLIDILDERPLFPFGPRRSLLPVIPGLLLAAGAFAALTGLIPSLSEASRQGMTAEANSAWMAAQLGLALRAAAWGFICAIGATLGGRLIEGAYDARSHGLDTVVETAFSSISPGELAELTRSTQQSSLDALGRELTGFAHELNERLDRGLQRIEQSTARAASLVSQEQRSALHTIVSELSLSVRQGVEHHLGELRGALQRAIEHQDSVSGGLAETFQNMVENSKVQDRVARTLDASATAVEEAARAMHGSTTQMHPVLEHLTTTSASLLQTADRIGDTQQVVARTAEGVRGALEHAATGVDDQRKFIELSLTEIRQAMVGLGDGLGESLQRSLHEVDTALGKSVAVFKDTLQESNETIDRLSSPIRATEGSTREIHLALDRVRGEIEVLAQWLNQASKPLRSGLADVDDRAEEISRAMHEFNNHARQIDKTMEALRHEIREESRRIQGAGGELGRRLQQASDAVGLLESTTSEAARRSRPEADDTRSRERQWSPAPANREPTDRSADVPPVGEPKVNTSQSSARSREREPSFTPRRFAPETTATSEFETLGDVAEPGSLNTPVSETRPITRPITPTPSREISDTGYRVGAGKAKGPDPYQRFDHGEEEPSNIRHFPAPERELGQDLNLSGLLGPRSDDSSSDTIPKRSQETLAGPLDVDDTDRTESTQPDDAPSASDNRD